jgi:Txe/YoeB family toxin of toxin-antitoxin system
LAVAGLQPKAEELLDILRKNPFQNPPPYEKLVGDLTGAYSRRINVQHRLVYQVLEQDHVVKVIRMWTLLWTLMNRVQPSSQLTVRSPSVLPILVGEASLRAPADFHKLPGAD